MQQESSRLIRFCSLLISSTVLSICAITIQQDKAMAWFAICNRSSQRTQAAFAYFDTGDNRPTKTKASVLGDLWVSEGYWMLNPGQCAQVYPHELWRRNRYYYVYAKSDIGTTWSGKQSFCIARGTAFTIYNADLSVNTSPPGSLANGCFIGEGNRSGSIEKVNFIKVDIGDDLTQNFTFNLTN